MYTLFIWVLTKNETIINEFLETFPTLSGEEVFLKLLMFVVIPFLFLNVLIVTITLLINHYIHLEILKRKKSVEEATDTILTRLLFWKGSFEEMRVAVEEFKYAVPYKKKWCRQFVLNRIIRIKLNFQLDDDTFLNIYKLFEFEKITYDLLRHKKWHKRSLGIYQLQFMHDVTKKKQLNILLNERNSQVKSNALMTLVTFSPERFAILADYQEPLNKADEIKIMDIIYHSTPVIPKNTMKLLKSKNTSIVVLGIKLIVLYRAQLSSKQINKLVRLSNFRVRIEAIKAVGKLRLTSANEILMSQYSIEQHKKIKINILISLKKIGNKETVEFLKSLLRNEEDSDIKFKIVDSLLTLEPSFFEEKRNANINFDEELKSMALHVKDPYLI